MQGKEKRKERGKKDNPLQGEKRKRTHIRLSLCGRCGSMRHSVEVQLPSSAVTV